MSEGPLVGIKVLDLSHYVAGPFCTKILADFGADVIKIERPPSGDPARRIGPFYHDDPHPEKSGLFLHLNTNKRSVTLNLKTQAGVKISKDLVEWADVLVESFAPTVMPSLGFQYETIKEINPRLVMTSISNFGQTGPYRDLKSEDLITYAMGGMMLPTGYPEREPAKLGLNVILYHAGAVSALATMVGVLAAEMQGTGDHVDISIMETQMGSVDRRLNGLMLYQYTGDVIYKRRGPGDRMGSGIFPTSDGYINITGGGNRLPQVAKMIGRMDLMEDQRFTDVSERNKPENAEIFNNEYLMPWLLERTMVEAWKAAQDNRILSGVSYTIADILKDPHFRQRGFWQEIDHPSTGKLTYAGSPFIMEKSPWSIRRPAPLLGQHNQEVLCDMLGYTKDDLVKLREQEVI